MRTFILLAMVVSMFFSGCGASVVTYYQPNPDIQGIADKDVSADPRYQQTLKRIGAKQEGRQPDGSYVACADTSAYFPNRIEAASSFVEGMILETTCEPYLQDDRGTEYRGFIAVGKQMIAHDESRNKEFWTCVRVAVIELDCIER